MVCRIDLGTGDNRLTDEDLRKIDRQVMNTRGDMLFARTLVFFEGETEEQALPDFAEKFWSKHPNDLGYSFIGVAAAEITCRSCVWRRALRFLGSFFRMVSPLPSQPSTVL